MGDTPCLSDCYSAGLLSYLSKGGFCRDQGQGTPQTSFPFKELLGVTACSSWQAFLLSILYSAPKAEGSCELALQSLLDVATDRFLLGLFCLFSCAHTSTYAVEARQHREVSSLITSPSSFLL